MPMNVKFGIISHSPALFLSGNRCLIRIFQQGPDHLLHILLDTDFQENLYIQYISNPDSIERLSWQT